MNNNTNMHVSLFRFNITVSKFAPAFHTRKSPVRISAKIFDFFFNFPQNFQENFIVEH
jgi:hypothetical protein